MNIDILIFEVTRKCNMQCPHCLRGEPQNINIIPDTINKSLIGIKSIKELVISGGEPSLNPKGFKHIVDVVIVNKINVEKFYVVTNAKRYSRVMVSSLQRLYIHCSNKERCALKMSKDEYHEPAYDETSNRYKLLPFYGERKFLHKIVNEGRAQKNGLANREIPEDTSKFIINEKSEIHMVYISAIGEVASACDLSYESLKEKNLGNILNDDLDLIIRRNIR